MILTTTSRSDFAAESGHWYLPDGAPFYSLTGANGKERPVTLRDARKMGAYPSVTKIIREAAAPGLERWKLRQLGLACLTLPRLEGESEDAFLARAEQDAQEQGRKAAERGTEIHAAIEQHYRGGYLGEVWTPWIIEVVGLLREVCGAQGWNAERSFAHPSGYGGKVDLHSPLWLLDVKTKDGDLPTNLYDEHIMQLAAYLHGLWIDGANAGIVFVGREQPKAAFVRATEEQLERGWSMFKALLAYWQAKTGYRP